jgi:ATP-dependent Clp protease ATP-binding subunit ClpC
MNYKYIDLKYSDLFDTDLKIALEAIEGEIRKTFPTYKITLDYLCYGLLTGKCYARDVLEKLVTSKAIEELQNELMLRMNTQCSLNNVHIINPRKEYVYDKTVINAVKWANSEVDNVGTLIFINTAHILLGFLEPKNSGKDVEWIRKLFNKKGVYYDNAFKKLDEIVKREMETLMDQFDSVEPVLIYKPSPNMESEDETALAVPEVGLVPYKKIPVPINGGRRGKETCLDVYCTNITTLYYQNKLDKVLCRENEIKAILKTLLKRDKNNVVLTGNNGVGISSMINLLAEKIVLGYVPLQFLNREILRINFDVILNGVSYKGMIEQRTGDILKELNRNPTKYILFLDDIYFYVDQIELMGFINHILLSGIPFICTCPTSKYKKTVEGLNLDKRMEKILIEEPNVEDTITILKNNCHYYEDFHNVTFADDTIEVIVKLSKRYITEKSLPSSALSVMDMAGSSTKLNFTNSRINNMLEEIKPLQIEYNDLISKNDYRNSDKVKSKINALNAELKSIKAKEQLNSVITNIEVKDILENVSEITGIPLSSVNSNERLMLSNIETVLKTKIVGQDDAISKIAATIKRNRLGIKSNTKKPPVFMLLGPSGVGKTYLCQLLAREIYGNEKYLIRLDMAEYSEKHTVQNIVGSPRSYVGYGEETHLISSIKKYKHSVILLDEIEKSCSEIFNVFLPVFDEGFLTDSIGEKIDFSNTIIIMTSNTGTRAASEYTKIGFGAVTIQEEDENKEKIIQKEIRKKFPPEFLSRINEIIFFNSLTKDNIKNIIRIKLDELNSLLNTKNYSLKYGNDTVEYIYNCIGDEEKKLGARTIASIIEREVETPITDLLINREYEENYQFLSKCSKEKLNIK